MCIETDETHNQMLCITLAEFRARITLGESGFPAAAASVLDCQTAKNDPVFRLQFLTLLKRLPRPTLGCLNSCTLRVSSHGISKHFDNRETKLASHAGGRIASVNVFSFQRVEGHRDVRQ